MPIQCLRGSMVVSVQANIEGEQFMIPEKAVCLCVIQDTVSEYLDLVMN